MATRRGSQDEHGKCGQCSEAVMEKHVGILCELCDTWYHAACEGVTDETYRILSMIEEIHWFCKKCNSHAVKMLKMIKSFGRLQDRVSSLEEHKMETDEEIKKIKDTLEGIKSVTAKQEVMSRFKESQTEQQQQTDTEEKTDIEEEIKRSNQKFQGIVLGQDMTKQQEMECKALVYEAETTTERAEGLCVQSQGPTGAINNSETLSRSNSCDNVLFTLLHTNVRGLLRYSKKEQLQTLLDDYKIGIMGITETFGTIVDLDSQFDFTGFTLYRKDRSAVNNKKMGGVALYVKDDDFSSAPCRDLNEMCCESVWCEVSVTPTDCIIVGVCYHSQRAGKEEVAEMFKCIEFASKMNKPILLMGDFNYPGINWSTNEADKLGNRFFKLVRKCHLKQHITKATRMDNILDLVFTKELLVVGEPYIIPPLENCDHNILILKIKREEV